MLAISILTALALYIAFGVWVVRRQKSRKAKSIAIAILMLIPTWDEIVGRAYFHYLCATEGGVKVYKTLDLPKEYWDRDGEPRFFRADGTVDKERLTAQVTFRRFYSDERNSLFRIRRTTDVIVGKSDQVLGEYTYLIYFGGWLVNSIGIHVSGMDCPKLESASFGKLVHATLRKQN